MNVEEYEKFHAETSTEVVDDLSGWLRAALGCFTEAGEVVGEIKHFTHDKLPLNREKLIAEIGDTFWYAALACRLQKHSLVTAMRDCERMVYEIEPRYDSKFNDKHKKLARLRWELMASSLGISAGLYLSDVQSVHIPETVPKSFCIAKQKEVSTLQLECVLQSILRIAKELGVPIEEILEINANKLRRRFHGGWSPEAVAAKADQKPSSGVIVGPTLADLHAAEDAREVTRGYLDANAIW